MSILLEKYLNMKQDLSLNLNFKKKYGEIHTNYQLIKEMFNTIPEQKFKNPNLRWLDIGTGKGFFSVYLFWKLNDSLKEIIMD